MWARESLTSHWWECNLVQPLGRGIWRDLVKMKMCKPHHLAVRLSRFMTQESRRCSILCFWEAGAKDGFPRAGTEPGRSRDAQASPSREREQAVGPVCGPAHTARTESERSLNSSTRKVLRNRSQGRGSDRGAEQSVFCRLCKCRGTQSERCSRLFV